MVFTTPVFWAFFLLTALSVFVLRERDPHVRRPFAVPLYPELPIAFSGICAYMIYAGLDYADRKLHMLAALLVLVAGMALVGLLLYRQSRGMTGAQLPPGPSGRAPGLPAKDTVFRPEGAVYRPADPPE
jgi:amino acid transporter